MLWSIKNNYKLPYLGGPVGPFPPFFLKSGRKKKKNQVPKTEKKDGPRPDEGTNEGTISVTIQFSTLLLPPPYTLITLAVVL